MRKWADIAPGWVAPGNIAFIVTDQSQIEALFAQELRRSIAVDGRSISAVGQAAGYSRSYLSQLLRGRQDLKLEHVERVLQVLEIDLPTFLAQVVRGYSSSESTPGMASHLWPATGGASPAADTGYSDEDSDKRDLESLAQRFARESLHETIRQVVQEELARSAQDPRDGEQDGADPHLQGPEAMAGERSGSRRLPAIAEQLVTWAREEALHDVSRAKELGRYAVELAEALPDSFFGLPAVARMRALAYGALANALRVNDELREAERTMTLAFGCLEKSHGDPVDEAELLSLLGSLRMHQTRYEEAEEVLARAADALLAQGECVRRARVLLQLGKARVRLGDPAEAIHCLEEAERWLTTPAQLDLRLYATHLRVGCLLEADRVEEARRLFDSLKPRWLDDMPGTANRLRVTWREGQLLWAEGRLVEAEAKLREVRDAFAELGHSYDVALVSLELACLHLDEGRTGEARELAASLLPVFGSLEVHRNALEALAVVHGALQAETATSQLLQETLRFLHRARRDPDFAFEPSGA